MLRIGLTGGIGSGKSTVCRLFAAYGVPIIDADEVSRELVEPGQPALAAILDYFGETLLTHEGRLDRARLRALIFAQPQQRQKLEALLHPLIRQRMLQLAQATSAPYLIFAIPLLVESGWQALVDRILVVDSPVELQYLRTAERDRTSRSQVEAIIATQAPREARLNLADEIIDNSGDMAHLQRQVEQLHQRYLRMASSSTTGP